MAENPQSGDQVVWGDIKAIAEKTDSLMKSLVIDPRGGNVRRTSIEDQTWTDIGGGDTGYGKDYNASHPYLSRDLTAPFPVDFPVKVKSPDG